jgi:hypothetical protein
MKGESPSSLECRSAEIDLAVNRGPSKARSASECHLGKTSTSLERGSAKDRRPLKRPAGEVGAGLERSASKHRIALEDGPVEPSSSVERHRVSVRYIGSVAISGGRHILSVCVNVVRSSLRRGQTMSMLRCKPHLTTKCRAPKVRVTDELTTEELYATAKSRLAKICDTYELNSIE